MNAKIAKINSTRKFVGLQYNILVNIDYPDGSTSWGYINYDILVNLTLQMAALI